MNKWFKGGPEEPGLYWVWHKNIPNGKPAIITITGFRTLFDVQPYNDFPKFQTCKEIVNLSYQIDTHNFSTYNKYIFKNNKPEVCKVWENMFAECWLLKIEMPEPPEET